ncbi:hypothetical protein K474DRAFT_1667191 [Panus rudis PR-1116 ss-1]|nr:hypothetical protein K474DRAFT_1667191 [Panus rudis PR-1116 ss-1]
MSTATSAVNPTETDCPDSSTATGKTLAEEHGLWFEDGSIILSAENTLFKVHRSVIHRYSEVFCDILAFPQPEADVEDSRVSELPVVHIPDTPFDTMHLLSAMYYGHKYFGESVTLPFETALSMLHMGTKYQIAVIRKEAILRLKLCFPTSLDDFCRLDLNCELGKHPNRVVDCGRICFRPRDAIMAVKMGITCDVPEILPAAFYICAQLPYSMLLNGAADDRGKVWKLDEQCLEACLKGRDKLRVAFMRSLRLLFFHEPLPGCISPKKCTEMKVQMLQRCCFDDFQRTHPLAQDWRMHKKFEGLLDNASFHNCEKCWNLEEQQEEFRAVIWGELNSYFSL